MARILIIEASKDLRNLVAHIVTRLGHEPVTHDGFAPDIDEAFDVMLVEPGVGRSLETVRALRDDHADVPIVCVSHFPPGAETATLNPVRHVMKPFRLAEIEAAVSAALLASSRPGGAAQPARV